MIQWAYSFFWDSFDADKYKRYLKLSDISLKQQRAKKRNMVAQWKEDIGKRLKQVMEGKCAQMHVEEMAAKVIHVEKELLVFDKLEHLLESLESRYGLVVEHPDGKKPPHYLMEACSSIIYAAGRLEQPSELHELSNQLGLKFGKEFYEASLADKELAVQPAIANALKVQVAPKFEVYAMLKEIAKLFALNWKPEEYTLFTANKETLPDEQPSFNPSVPKDTYKPSYPTAKPSGAYPSTGYPSAYPQTQAYPSSPQQRQQQHQDFVPTFKPHSNYPGLEPMNQSYLPPNQINQNQQQGGPNMSNQESFQSNSNPTPPIPPIPSQQPNIEPPKETKSETQPNHIKPAYHLDPTKTFVAKEPERMSPQSISSLQERLNKLKGLSSSEPTKKPVQEEKQVKPSEPSYPRVRAEYDFKAAQQDELSVTAGETLSRMPDRTEEGWVVVMNQQGEKGLIPETYLSASL